ncbi:MAG TPA: SusC/RagA family TonB-linked outer membrane protein [Longimicrobiales bacterium]|nr:SusC/RagA family TonB-linked outer membrane protein [Longimicrobiales bacterium]
MSTVGALLLLVTTAGTAQAQGGTIAGRVTTEEGTPLVGAQVQLEATGYGAATDEEGRYQIRDVRPGTYNVTVEFIGYATQRRPNVVVRSDQVAAVDFRVATQVLRLQEVVVSGVADPIEGTRAPFSVARVTRAQLTVPSVNMASAIQGRVAGARIVSGSGMPGSGVDIRLRSRLGVNTSDAPLIVVDGVIQVPNNDGNTSAYLVDLDAKDIENIEVLKGAAAASLYGSRAQAGAIEITTRNGREVQFGQTRITVRSEYGQSFLGDVPSTATHHPFLMNGQGQWIDEDGTVVARVDRVLRPDRMVATPYSGRQYNHLDLFFDPGRFVNNNLSIAQNTQSTNFFVSLADLREPGVVPDFNDGYHRQNLRFNLDHRVRSDLTVGLTTYLARSEQQNLQDGGANVFYDLRFIAPDIDLTAPNVNSEGKVVGPYVIFADSTANQNSPLYALWANDDRDYNKRAQGAVQLRYNPMSWFNVDGLIAYDRSDRERHYVRPDDYVSADPDVLGDGFVERRHNYSQGWNGHLQGTLIRTFGDLTARTRMRWNFERTENSGFIGGGSEYIVKNIPTINNMVDRNASGGEFTRVRQEGFMVNTALNFRNRYIGDFLIRRDGSSLFGSSSRWNNYYRASLSYVMSEEDWWPFEFLTDFKPRASIATAGARPGFTWQYETWNVGSSGPSKGTLGNRELKPEKTTEREFGVDFIINDRYSVELTYVNTTTVDQLIPVPLPDFYGYSSQWQNVGTVKGNAYEATFEAALVQKPDVGWSMGLILDRADSWLDDWRSNCYRTSAFYRCQGEKFSTMRMPTWMKSLDDLPAFHSGSRDQFQVNDDGYVVPVGNFDFTDGMSQNLWGTRVTIDGNEYAWGLPIYIMDEDGQLDDLHVAGDANPDFHLGWSNRLRWRGFTISSLVDAKIGGDIYNGTAQWPYRDNMSLDQVQAGKSPEHQKPLDYYQTLYSTNRRNSHFVEDGTYIKFRELQIGYRLDRQALNRVLLGGLGLESLTLNLLGRNLFTITDYSGLDPEVGSNGAGGPVENPTDSFGYPNFRQFTLSVEIQF